VGREEKTPLMEVFCIRIRGVKNICLKGTIGTKK
jgi:hypothetical protein